MSRARQESQNASVRVILQGKDTAGPGHRKSSRCVPVFLQVIDAPARGKVPTVLDHAEEIEQNMRPLFSLLGLNDSWKEQPGGAVALAEAVGGIA